jgi:hypothetical protein
MDYVISSSTDLTRKSTQRSEELRPEQEANVVTQSAQPQPLNLLCEVKFQQAGFLSALNSPSIKGHLR